MKKIIAAVFTFVLAASVFAQSDLTPLAVIKLNKSETITLKQVKAKTVFVQKQMGIENIPLEQRRQIFESMVNEKLIVQAAAKEGINVTDSQVDSEFLRTFSQQLGVQVTETQLSELIKKQTNMTLDEYLKENTGMTVAEYKVHLKSQIIAQQYVFSKKQDEIMAVAANDDEIRKYYDLNKQQFVMSDMMKLYLVVVPKGTDAVAAKATCQDLRNKYEKDPAYGAKLKADEGNGKTFRAGEMFLAKNVQHAQQLRWSYDKLLELFGKKEKYLSEVTETASDFQFYAILKKYDAKMLGIGDLVQPETTVTVYDYIKNALTSQKQMQYFSVAASDLAKLLDVPANIERKKKGADLDKLLNW